MRLLYLTARPGWLGGRSRDLVEERGFPPGTVRSTASVIGATGASAETLKSAP